MRTRSEMIKKLVISQKEGIIEGMIEDILLDVEQNLIIGWSFRREGFFSSQGLVSAEDSFLGRDVLLVEQTGDFPDELDKFLCWGKDLIKNPVIDRLGRELSTVGDLLFDENYTRLIGIIIQDGRVLLLSEQVSVRGTVVVVPQDCRFTAIEEKSEESWWTRFWNGFS